jgi:hypothetical protein
MPDFFTCDIYWARNGNNDPREVYCVGETYDGEHLVWNYTANGPASIFVTNRDGVGYCNGTRVFHSHDEALAHMPGTPRTSPAQPTIADLYRRSNEQARQIVTEPIIEDDDDIMSFGDFFDDDDYSNGEDEDF